MVHSLRMRCVTAYYAVVIFRVEHKEVEFLCGGMASVPATDLEDLRKKIAIGQFTENFILGWVSLGLMAAPFEGLSRLT